MRLSTAAIAAGLTVRDAPVAGAAFLALLLVVAMLHQDMRASRTEHLPAAPPMDTPPTADAGPGATLEPVLLQPPPAEPALEAPPAAEAEAPEPPSDDPPSDDPPSDDPPADPPAADPPPADPAEADPAEADTPADEPIVARLPAPRPARPAAETPPADAARVVALRPNGATMQRGRILLQLLESGAGPNVVIGWPADPAEQERLAVVLARCYGMELALLRRDNTVLRAGDPPGMAQPIDFDRWSRFPRAPSGMVTAFERTIEAELRRHHRQADGLFESRPVRLFPRPIDAALLGGLETLLGQDYAQSEEIRLAYELSGQEVRLVDLHSDGRPLPGALVLPRQGACAA